MKSESISAGGKLMLAFALVLGSAAVATLPAHAQTFSVVHNFTGGNDGGVPFNGLTADGKILYGTASVGGTSNNGVVFKISASGAETVLHNFAGGTDGATPQGELIRGKGADFYGTTTAGGTDGAVPEAGLVFDAAGNLYGTTSEGGANGNGTVFKLAAPKTKGGSWTESVLYSFGTGTDGSVPVGGVSFGSAGNLYGTTSAGGAYGFGTVFQLVAGSGWTENILYDFQNANDGAVPYAGLISDKAGNFYGAATEGGANG